MNWIDVPFHGKMIRVPAIKHQNRLWFHWLGETHVVELNLSRRSGADRAKAHPGVIHSPMPGKITQVRAELGASVKKGEPLIVMEAMKMEYTLEADRDGKITELKAQLGSQVALGEILARIGDP